MEIINSIVNSRVIIILFVFIVPWLLHTGTLRDDGSLEMIFPRRLITYFVVRTCVKKLFFRFTSSDVVKMTYPYNTYIMLYMHK
jgi:hypothetical protein